MHISIIIPALNEENNLPYLLDSISTQDTTHYLDVIIADNGSEDRTKDVAKYYGAFVENVPIDEHLGAVRNAGARIASGDYLIFMDADTEFADPNQITRIMEYIVNGDIDWACALRKTPDHEKSLKSWFWYARQNAFRKLRPFVDTSFMIIKRDIFYEIGEFNESLRYGIDTEFGMRGRKMGYKCKLLNEHIITSPRRLDKLGYLEYYLRHFKSRLYLEDPVLFYNFNDKSIPYFEKYGNLGLI